MLFQAKLALFCNCLVGEYHDREDALDLEPRPKSDSSQPLLLLCGKH